MFKFGRKFLLPAFLAASIGVPYSMWNPDVGKKVQGLFSARESARDAPQHADGGHASTIGWEHGSGDAAGHGDGHAAPAFGAAPAANPVVSVATNGGRPIPPLVGEPVQNLAEVLRFDISPRWVMSRWSRVSTTMADLQLQGLRVPLVTGTDVNDLAGSLTYYFDKEQTVKRITFDGYTGDERKLVDLVSQQFGFRAEPSIGAGLYLAKWNGKPTSALRVSHAPVMRAESPHSRLAILLEINRPDSAYGLSPTVKQILSVDQSIRRW